MSLTDAHDSSCMPQVIQRCQLAGLGRVRVAMLSPGVSPVLVSGSAAPFGGGAGGTRCAFLELLQPAPEVATLLKGLPWRITR